MAVKMYWLGAEERLTFQRFLDRGYIVGKVKTGVLLENERSRKVAAKGGKFYEGQAKLLMWKIDAVIEAEEAVWVVQVTDVLGIGDIEKVMRYKKAYEEQYKPKKPVKMAIVAKVDRPKLHYLMRDLGIRWFIV